MSKAKIVASSRRRRGRQTSDGDQTYAKGALNNAIWRRSAVDITANYRVFTRSSKHRAASSTFYRNWHAN